MTLTLTRVTRNSTYADITALQMACNDLALYVVTLAARPWSCDLRSLPPHAAVLEQARADLAALQDALREAEGQP